MLPRALRRDTKRTFGGFTFPAESLGSLPTLPGSQLPSLHCPGGTVGTQLAQFLVSSQFVYGSIFMGSRPPSCPPTFPKLKHPVPSPKCQPVTGAHVRSSISWCPN